MKLWTMIPLAMFAAGCATAPTPVASEDQRADQGRGQEWTDAEIRQDVEKSVAERFGAASYRRAVAAEASVMVKLYRGMPMPPVQQPDGSWREVPHPVALLVREDGQWLKADEDGFRPVRPILVPEFASLLESTQFWAESARVPQGGCTDGGSSLIVIRLPGRSPAVRQGTCGGPELHSRLISLAMSA